MPTHLAVLVALISGSFPFIVGSLWELEAAYGAKCPAVTRQIS
jgi:hypothetical protein